MFLGIDTSCYTTSVAVVNRQGALIADNRQVLKVKAGQKGLRQSEAVFQHVQNLPLLLEQTAKTVELKQIRGVCVSSAPRNVEGSYMPVFTVGMAAAKTIAISLGVPLFETSHQEGHIMAAEWSSGAPEAMQRISIHLSGGTTEILHSLSTESGYHVDILGKSLDLHAGQLIDRVGVAVNLAFPCGKELDKLAQKSETKVKIPISVNSGNMNLSGAEAVAMKALREGAEPGAVARGVFEAIAQSLCTALRQLPEKPQDIIMAGGVSANTIIRDYMQKHFDGDVYFAQPEYATDNAVGTALIGRKRGKE